MKIQVFTLLAIVAVKSAIAQGSLDYLKSRVKDKAQEKSREKLEKNQKEYDESNFNYAILFLENSSAFESTEQGNAFASNVLNTGKFLKNEEKSTEDRAYTNLKNGEILYNGNKYYLAEQSFKLAKFLYEDAGQTNTTNYGQTLSDLALLYQSRGNYTKAKEFSDKALSLRRELDNKGMLLVSINNDAVLKKSMGQFPEAEESFNEALRLAAERSDKEASALVHNNLAMNALDMNKLADAEKNIDLCIKDATAIMKEDESNFIKLQINKANISRLQKKYPEAESLYLKCIAVKEKKLGAHPDLAQLKLGLAQLYMEMRKSTEAESLLQSAYDIFKRKLGEKNPATLGALQQLANYYSATKNYAKALELIKTVVDAKKIIYGENHPNYVQALEDQAIILWQNQKIAEAKTAYQKVLASTLDYINHFFVSLNENEKNLYWDKTNLRLQRFYAFASGNCKSDAELTTLLFNTLLNTKGFLLNNSARIRNTILASADTTLIGTYKQWLQTKENLNLAFQLSREEQMQEHINVDSLKERSGQLEKYLSKQSALFKESLEEKSFTQEQLRSALKPTEALVEIVEILPFGENDKELYMAMVLKQSGLKLVEIAKGEEIENAVKSFRDKIIHTKPEAEAYGILWKPLEEELKGISRLFISLDGAYHKVALNALKDATGKYLADKFEITLVGNSADLLSVKASEKISVKPTSAELFGNPLYGKKGLVQQLDGTETEVKNIAALLSKLNVKTRAVYGADATEGAVKNLNSPGILHIATHGYFLNDVSKREGEKVLGVDKKTASENPLLRSGLLLANCENVYEENYHPALSGENGILTAYEAMNLNLDKTELVVLSACETGLGSIKQGEGVYGLQRSFLIAGAKSIVMSLWSVSDEATMELMTLFYTNYAKTGNKSQAFSDAIKQLKLKYKQPFYWSAFVMLSR